MNAPAVIKVNIPSLEMEEAELVRVLQSSLYHGAQIESIKLVIGYCRARNLDPMQKPVHIVPMSVKKPGTKNDYEMRDTIMPGIGLYRVQASRTGEYAGISEPEFGPMVKMEFKESFWDDDGQGGRSKQSRTATIEFPTSCRITVNRIIRDSVVAFTAIEFWMENYATAGKDSTAPNAMWKRRPRGQLAKCAEAQALRKAFPETGGQPTADEMEGKSFDDDMDQTPRLPAVVEQPRAKAAAAPAATQAPAAKAAPATPASGPIEDATILSETKRDSAPAAKPTLQDCMKLLDDNLEYPDKIMPQVFEYRKMLPEEDRKKLDDMIEALGEERKDKAPKADVVIKPLIDGQKKILRARLRANDKTVEQLEEFMKCKLDEIAFDDFGKAQTFAAGA